VGLAPATLHSDPGASVGDDVVDEVAAVDVSNVVLVVATVVAAVDIVVAAVAAVVAVHTNELPLGHVLVRAQSLTR
jgi:hypothetical protein